MPAEISFTLSIADYELLLLVMGYAAGAAHKDKDEVLFNSFLRLANRVNAHNPAWTPYVTLNTPVPN